MRIFFIYQVLLVTCILTSGCTNPSLQQEISELKLQLSDSQLKMEALQSQIEQKGHLVHLVFFNLVIEIQKLEKILVVRDLQFGPFEYLGDKRALAAYDMMMELSFDSSRADYQLYIKATPSMYRSNKQLCLC